MKLFRRKKENACMQHVRCVTKDHILMMNELNEERCYTSRMTTDETIGNEKTHRQGLLSICQSIFQWWHFVSAVIYPTCFVESSASSVAIVDIHFYCISFLYIALVRSFAQSHLIFCIPNVACVVPLQYENILWNNIDTNSASGVKP